LSDEIADRKKNRAAALSITSNTVLVLFKLVVGISINSVGIISEAIHSGLDLLAALLAFFAVSLSGKPPDEQHRYGHGKIENISGVVEAALIFIAAVWIIVEAVQKLKTGSHVTAPSWGLLVMGLSGLLNFFISGILLRTAKETDSVALEADGWHLRTDVYTSAGVGLGMLLIWITGYALLDPLIAIFVALLIVKASVELTAKAFMPLLDASLPREEEAIIRETIDRCGGGVLINFHDLRTRKAGSKRLIDLHLVMPRQMSIGQSHALCDRIEAALGEQLPAVDILIHVEPCQSGDDCRNCPGPCDPLSK
jgi:cation diffusion facilitator family transporter